MKKLTFTLLSLLCATGGVAQTSNERIDAGILSSTVSIGGVTASATLNQVTGFLANQLANNRNLKNVTDSRIAVASFVNMNNLEETDRLGVAVAENLMHEMYVRGFGVVDFKTRDSLKVRPNGDFVFSRDINELRKQYNVHYFLSGTINRNADGAVINARLIQADTGLIVSSAQSFLANRELHRVLGEPSAGVTEKIVIERPIIPAVRQNTVSLK